MDRTRRENVFFILFVGIYFDSGGHAREPSTEDYSRFDLNGDGFTGGSSADRFDLDRVGSTQYGATRYDSVVTQQIEGLTVSFDESKLTDLDILCFYAYSPLYTGDATARTSLLAGSCALAIQPTAVTILSGRQQRFVVSPANAPVKWSSTCGSIDTTGLYTAGSTAGACVVRATSTSAAGRFAEARVTVVSGALSGRLTWVWHDPADGTAVTDGSGTVDVVVVISATGELSAVAASGTYTFTDVFNNVSCTDATGTLQTISYTEDAESGTANSAALLDRTSNDPTHPNVNSTNFNLVLSGSEMKTVTRQVQSSSGDCSLENLPF